MIVNSLDIWQYEEPPFTQYNPPPKKNIFCFHQCCVIFDLSLHRPHFICLTRLRTPAH